MSNKSIFLTFLAVLALTTAYQSLFIVNQTEQALVLRFGRAVDFEDMPGLKTKMPFIDDVVYYDKRVLEFNAESEEVILRDQDRLVVDAFVKYKIINPLEFFRTVRNERGLNEKLDSILNDSLRQVLGGVVLDDLLSDRRSTIMKDIRDQVYYDVTRQARAAEKDVTAADEAALPEEAKTVSQADDGFGIKIVDVRVMRADLPEQISNDVYERMRSDRQKVAAAFRAEGDKQAQIIRSEADKTRTVILAQAEKKSQILRGEGDAKATKIFADAFNRDKEFFDLYRSLQAYRATINKDDTTMIMSPDGEFLRYLDKETR